MNELPENEEEQNKDISEFVLRRMKDATTPNRESTREEERKPEAKYNHNRRKNNKKHGVAVSPMVFPIHDDDHQSPDNKIKERKMSSMLSNY